MLKRSVRERRICMSIHKDNVTGKWRVVYRYTDWTGETHQSSKRGFPTKREAQMWERELLLKKEAKLDMTFESFYEIYVEDMQNRIRDNTGVAVNSLLKQAGIKFGVKFANGVIKKIPGKVLTKINQKVGFRFITKFGSKEIVNLGKMLPGVSAIVGGGLDLVETKVITDRAYKWFMTGDFSVKGESNDDVIDIDDNDYNTTEIKE